MRSSGRAACVTPERSLQKILALLVPLLCLPQFLPAAAAGTQQSSVGPDLSVRVRVNDARTYEPLQGALVELQSASGTLVSKAFSDERGCADFSGLSLQPYRARVSLQGFTTSETVVEVAARDVFREVTVSLPRIPSKALPHGSTISARTLAIPARALREVSKGLVHLKDEQKPFDSVPHFRKATKIFPDYYEAYYLLGMAHLETHSTEDAKTDFQNAIAREPEFALSYHPLAVILIAQKRFDEADRLLLRAMEIDPGGWQWPYQLARSQGGRGQWDKALEYGLRARDQPNAPPKIHLLMVDIYRNRGDTQNALRELEEFAALDPHSSYMPRVRQAISELRAQAQEQSTLRH
ncbi:MAG: carboxypeptidase regulatory-like domain-containing protein [Terriglobia bacterium]